MDRRQYLVTEAAFWLVAAVVLGATLLQSTPVEYGILLVLLLRGLLVGERIERHLRQA